MVKLLTILLLLVPTLAISSDADEATETPVNGHGRASLPDSSVYEGEFQNGLFHGKGILTWRNGDKYEGEFKEGLRRGKGVWTDKRGYRYEGEYKDGVQHGKGTLVRAKGGTYTWTFSEGCFHGQGTMTYALGIVDRGTWTKGTLTKRDYFDSGILWTSFWTQFWKLMCNPFVILFAMGLLLPLSLIGNFLQHRRYKKLSSPKTPAEEPGKMPPKENSRLK